MQYWLNNMLEKGLFVTIHGIDGTGKTTASRTVTNLLVSSGMPAINYDTYEKNVHNPFSPAKKRVLAETTPAAQLAYFLGSTLFHSSQIEGLLAKGFTVVKSRFIDDVMAHHAHLGVEDTPEIAAFFPIVKPDLKAILILNETNRRERIMRRGELDNKDKEIRQHGSRLDFFEQFLLSINRDQILRGEAMVINTAEYSINNVGQMISDAVIKKIISRREDEAV